MTLSPVVLLQTGVEFMEPAVAERELSRTGVVDAARYLDGQIVRTPVVNSVAPAFER